MAIENKIPKYTIFIGNPGVGKSSLLNGLFGHVAFKAGAAVGSGVTQKMDMKYHEDLGQYFADTPGLEDVKTREAAAKEIVHALKFGAGIFQLVFVVKDDSLRVRPSDVATLNLVLDAINIDQTVSFGVIVNDILPKHHKRLEDNELEKEMFTACYKIKYATDYFHFCHLHEDLTGEEDAIPNADIVCGLKNFLRDLPHVTLNPNQVGAIKGINQFESIIEETMLEMKRELDELRNKLKEQEKEHKRFRQEWEKEKNKSSCAIL